MSGRARPKFTVFTPTFDRASTLGRVKDSLERQTFTDFEWVIVDDGSSDGTDEMVSAWVTSSPLEIRYFHQSNSGKHVAFNRGVREARGELFLTIDSDDECVPSALERLLELWESIPGPARTTYSGVSVLAMREDGTTVGERFPQDVYDSDALHKYFASVGRGDKWGFHRTDVLRRYPFPEPPGVKHVGMSVVWLAVGRDFKTRFANDHLLIVHADASGGRLHHFNERTAPGRRIFHQEVVTKYIEFLSSSPALVVKSGVNYCRYSFHCGIGPVGQLTDVGRVTSRLLVAACMIPGALFYARDHFLASGRRDG